MALFHIVLLLSILYPDPAFGAIPDGRSLQVDPHCGADISAASRVSIATDVAFPKVRAVCAGNKEIPFFKTGPVNFLLPAFYQGGENQCLFERHGDTDLYSIQVHVGWGSATEQLQSGDESFYVTCTLGNKGAEGSEYKDIGEALVAPREIQINLGDDSNSDFSLRMTDIEGDTLLMPVDIGKYVKIIATSNGAGGEIGLRAVSCDAVGVNTNKKFAILRAGCGDGMILGKKTGFITEGLTATSPYFPSFRLFNDYNLHFDCNFTLCQDHCDGSSCKTESVPAKRSVDEDNLNTNIVRLSSDNIELHHSMESPEDNIAVKNVDDHIAVKKVSGGHGNVEDMESMVSLSLAGAAIIVFLVILWRTIDAMCREKDEPMAIVVAM